jgi:hypothetical protein
MDIDDEPHDLFLVRAPTSAPLNTLTLRLNTYAHPTLLALTDASHDLPFATFPLMRVLSLNADGLVLDLPYLQTLISAKIQDEPVPDFLFRRQGARWILRFAGEPFDLEDSKGLRVIANLLSRPATEVHVLELAAVADDLPFTQAEIVEALRAERGLELLGRDDIKMLRHTVRKMQREIDHATANGDEAKVRTVTDEKERIEAVLSKDLNQKGESRYSSSPSSKARTNINRQIGRAIAQIEKHNKEAARFIDHSLGRGFLCIYRPDRPVDWVF